MAQARRDFWIAAVSNLSTAYNLVNINLAHVDMENQFCGGDKCGAAVTTASTACLAGAIIGQLFFGYVGDCLGRRPALRLTMIMSVVGALISAFAVPLQPDNPTSAFTFLSIARLLLGIGVGGVYPLAATSAAEAAESSNDSKRGRSVALVFSMQGVGTLLVPIVGMVFFYGLGTYKTRLDAKLPLPGIAWRLILGIGALPGIILMPFQMCQSNSAVQTASPRNSGGLTLMQVLKDRTYWRTILGCAGGWFLFDITFYGNTLFSPTVLHDVFGVATGLKGFTPLIENSIKFNLCWQLAILALIGLPGYYVSVGLMDKVGPKNIQLQGFVMMALLYGILGMFLKNLEQLPEMLLFIYGLTYFFSNFGPNSTTFILPAESFPEQVRSSMNGFCAASGKLGATLGSSVFKALVKAVGAPVVFLLCAACAAVGIVITIFCIDDRRGKAMEGGEHLVTSNGESAREPDLSHGVSIQDQRPQT